MAQDLNQAGTVEIAPQNVKVYGKTEQQDAMKFAGTEWESVMKIVMKINLILLLGLNLIGDAIQIAGETSMAGIVQVILTIKLNQLFVKKYVMMENLLEEKNVMMEKMTVGDVWTSANQTSKAGIVKGGPQLRLLYAKRFVETEGLSG